MCIDSRRPNPVEESVELENGVFMLRVKEVLARFMADINLDGAKALIKMSAARPRKRARNTNGDESDSDSNADPSRKKLKQAQKLTNGSSKLHF